MEFVLPDCPSAPPDPELGLWPRELSLAGNGSRLGHSQPCLAVFFRMLAELPSPGKSHWKTTRKIRSKKLYDTKVLPLSLSGVVSPGEDSAFREPDVSRGSRSDSACSGRSPEQTWSLFQVFRAPFVLLVPSSFLSASTCSS